MASRYSAQQKKTSRPSALDKPFLASILDDPVLSEMSGIEVAAHGPYILQNGQPYITLQRSFFFKAPRWLDKGKAPDVKFSIV